MKDILVRTRGLKKYYQVGDQTVKALDGVDLEVREREFVSIIGKSGSGKKHPSSYDRRSGRTQ